MKTFATKLFCILALCDHFLMVTSSPLMSHIRAGTGYDGAYTAMAELSSFMMSQQDYIDILTDDSIAAEIFLDGTVSKKEVNEVLQLQFGTAMVLTQKQYEELLHKWIFDMLLPY